LSSTASPAALLARLGRTLASLRVAAVLLALLAVVVAAGTIHQAAHSVEDARARFFDAWISWVGFVPLPGGRLLFAALAASSLASIFFTAVRRDPGLVVVHLGLVLLFAGVFQMSLFTRESIVALTEGERTAVSIDPREFELVAGLAGSGDYYGIPLRSLRPGSVVPIPRTDVALHVRRLYPHSRVVSPLEGGAGFVLAPEAPPQRIEEARPGLVAALDGPAPAEVELYGGAAAATEVATRSGMLELRLRPLRLPLPFSVELTAFEREVYPGGDIPRAFSSLVVLRDASAERHVLIAMNRPARHAGYALYQSSWGMDPQGRELSVLQVVRNPVRALPYVATATIAVGLALTYTRRAVRRRAERAG
jgi:hypothetical protein